MENLLTLIWLIILFVIIVFYCERMIRRTAPKNTAPKNKVHFYIARDGYGELFLFLGKPVRKNVGKGRWTKDTPYVTLLATNGLGTLPPLENFRDYNLDEDDFKNIKWEDEPVEVFLNLDD